MTVRWTATNLGPYENATLNVTELLNKNYTSLAPENEASTSLPPETPLDNSTSPNEGLETEGNHLSQYSNEVSGNAKFHLTDTVKIQFIVDPIPSTDEGTNIQGCFDRNGKDLKDENGEYLSGKVCNATQKTVTPNYSYLYHLDLEYCKVDSDASVQICTTIYPREVFLKVNVDGRGSQTSEEDPKVTVNTDTTLDWEYILLIAIAAGLFVAALLAGLRWWRIKKRTVEETEEIVKESDQIAEEIDEAQPQTGHGASGNPLAGHLGGQVLPDVAVIEVNVFFCFHRYIA